MGTSGRTPQNPHGDGRYIPALDGWRAVAIGMVMLFHGLFNTDTEGHRLLESVTRLASRTGALGVLVFFCISGYIITSRLHADSVAAGKVSLGAFYIKRVFRILPPMWLYLVTIALLYVTHVIHLVRGDWAGVVFLSNYFPNSWFIDHFWSLSIEEHFYLFWPLCILVVGWRRALWAGLAIIAAVAVWRPWQISRIPVPPSDPQYRQMRGIVLAHTGSRIDYIMAGCVVALLLLYHPSTKRFLHWCGSGLGMVVLFALLSVSTLVDKLDLRTIQAMVLALMVCGSSLSDTWFSRRVLSQRFVLWIGKVSYSLYLWQQLFLSYSRVAWLRSPWALPLKWAAAMLAAYVSYRFVERPAIRYGRRLLDRRSALGEAETAPASAV